MTARPTFTELLDWIEGRLTDEAAAAVATYVDSGDPATSASVAWIRDFLAAAGSMPLSQPPPDLSARLRGVFDELHRPMRAEGWSDAWLLQDARSGLAAAGVRSSADGGVHLAFDSELGRFVLDATGAGVGEVDVQGLVMLAPGAGGVDLAFLAHGDLRRAVRTTPDGRFDARGVPLDVDELWLTSGATRVRATLDLRR
ncbi:hypothetical protein RB608_18700 [Nocardioides sp. LHD-245]|uniref:hypothetical protein n=1 Tax=Nocardioides sp. LHD-245 TaxID=3051387 RepID=UPI0027E1720D|nr:hypothetical protein [Nocardioides sp. LHD-245]